MVVLYCRYNMATGSVEDRALFKKVEFHYAIFDEGHMLKNMSSLRYQNLMKIAVSVLSSSEYTCLLLMYVFYYSETVVMPIISVFIVINSMFYFYRSISVQSQYITCNSVHVCLLF